MSNATYDRIKFAALIVAPITVFVGAVMGVWHVPYATEVTATLAAVDVFVGSLVKILAARYNEGETSEGLE